MKYQLSQETKKVRKEEGGAWEILKSERERVEKAKELTEAIHEEDSRLRHGEKQRRKGKLNEGMRSQALLSKKAERDRQGEDSWRPQLPAAKAPGGGGEGGERKGREGGRRTLCPLRFDRNMRRKNGGREEKEGREVRREGERDKQTKGSGGRRKTILEWQRRWCLSCCGRKQKLREAFAMPRPGGPPKE